MGQRGPIPFSADHHRRNGTYRPSRHGQRNRDGLPIEIPDAPAELTPQQHDVWHALTSRLCDAGLISRLDGFALFLLTTSWTMLLECNSIIAREGLILNERGKPRLHPAARMRTHLISELLALFDRFGMSPRARMSVSPHPRPEDDEEAALAVSIFGD